MTRWMRIILVFSLLAASIGACEKPKLEELKRLRSPDGWVDAVLIKVSADATVGFSHRIYLVQAEERIHGIDDKYPVLNAVKVNEIDIKWMENKELVISYDRMKILHFENFWYGSNLDGLIYEVNVRLQRAKN